MLTSLQRSDSLRLTLEAGSTTRGGVGGVVALGLRRSGGSSERLVGAAAVAEREEGDGGEEWDALSLLAPLLAATPQQQLGSCGRHVVMLCT